MQKKEKTLQCDKMACLDCTGTDINKEEVI